MKFRLIKKKESWRLTLLGWSVFFLMMASLALVGLRSIYPFLALNQPISGELLVVEGWVPDYLFEDVRSEFEKGGYKFLVITGNPILKGEPLAEYKNYADLTKAILLKNGWPSEKVIAVPSNEALKDRTYAAALALREWISRSKTPIHSFTIFSRGAHARRTWMLFQMAMSDQIQVGVIASRDLRYDEKHWWKSSEGVRDIIDETIAYLYARLLFQP